MSNLILSKESSESEIKAYFNAVLKLSQSDNEFPINLDEVWMLVYSSRSKAVRALKDNFIENEDYLPVSKNGQRSDDGRFSNGNQTDYFLSLSCMEFFIARKVRPVFEVYRQVFHRTVRSQLSPIEMQLEMMKSMQLQLQELIETKAEIKQLKSEVEEIKQRTTTDLHQSTIVAFITRNHIKLDVTKYGAMGRKATSICKKRGLNITKINDVRWGKVSVYPDSVLEEVFKINN